MVLYSCNNSIMCLTFLSSLKDAASVWFYSLPPCSLHNFSKVTDAFIIQYASHYKAKRSSHHLLSVKMKPGDGLKSYINFFQSQLTKVSNYD